MNEAAESGWSRGKWHRRWVWTFRGRTDWSSPMNQVPGTERRRERDRQTGRGKRRKPFGPNSSTSWKLVSEQTGKYQQNPTCSMMTMVLRSLGSEKDGLVYFYCLANSSNSPVCSSIIHSILRFPSKLASSSLFFSFQILSFPPPFFFRAACSPLSVLRASEHRLRYIKDERARIFP